MGGMHGWKWNEHGCMAFQCWTSSWQSCFWLEFCLWFFWEQCAVICDNVWRAEQGSDSSIGREELSGWELIVGDVFHTQISEAFCATITGMAVVAIGFMFPVSCGMLLTGTVLLHLFWEKIVAIYMASSMCRIISGDSKGWISVSWWVASFFPGIAFLKVTVLNFILCGSDSTGTRLISLFFFTLWFGILVPLTLLGGCHPWDTGGRSQSHFHWETQLDPLRKSLLKTTHHGCWFWEQRGHSCLVQGHSSH